MTTQQRCGSGPINGDVGLLHNRAPWINVVSGVLVYISRWVIHPTSYAAGENIFWMGIIIVCVAMVSAGAHGYMVRNYWSAINVVAGIWLIVSLAVIPNTSAMMWPQVCLGIITALTALIALSCEYRITRRFLHRS